MPSVEPRRVLIHGAHNVRDLGGMTATDGRYVRRGRIFRSDFPTAAEAFVRAVGISTVVDLRRQNEAAMECPDWSTWAVKYHRWPLTAASADSWHARYVSYLEHRPETVVGAVREVMRAASRPTLFHCAAGKDRTGVVAALLLGVLGVSHESIEEDYLLSAPSVEAIMSRLLTLPMYLDMLSDSSVAEQLPRRELMSALLLWLDERGGPASWLLSAGAVAAEIDAFRAEMLVDE